jgi:glycosyltransferase involved in cell wall biosynthesis
MKLSVITINRNNAEGLDKTIQSVINQSYNDFEYIVIDGNSTDDSVDIIKKYDNKINCWISETDTGIYNAMNKGIAKANGNYLLFLNSGDYLVNKDVLKSVFEYQQTADIIYGNMQIDWGNGKITSGKMPDKITFKQMYIDTLWHPVSFIKKTLFNKYGLYNETYKIVADYDFFFKVIIKHNATTYHVNVDIAMYNLTGLSSLDSNKALEQAERKKVIESYLPQSIIDFAIDTIVPDKLSIFDRLKNKFF